MHSPLVIKKQISIQAPPSSVWSVLTKPVYIRQWDELPDNHADQAFLEVGSQIFWDQPNGQSTKLTVSKAINNQVIKINLFNSSWPNPESTYDIFYLYTLRGKENGTVLEIEIGDFSALTDGEKYFEASLDFGETAAVKIKSLAESIQIDSSDENYLI